MKLYWLAAERRYVHRQSDIPKGVVATSIDVPTDLPGLMAYLNNLALNKGNPLDHPAPGEQLLNTQPLNCAMVDNEADMQRVLDAGAGVGVVFSGENSQKIDEPPAPIVPPPPDMSATAVLSRCDNPGTNVDAVVETICKAKGYALKRYAGAVATAFLELEKR